MAKPAPQPNRLGGRYLDLEGLREELQEIQTSEGSARLLWRLDDHTVGTNGLRQELRKLSDSMRHLTFLELLRVQRAHGTPEKELPRDMWEAFTFSDTDHIRLALALTYELVAQVDGQEKIFGHDYLLARLGEPETCSRFRCWTMIPMSMDDVLCRVRAAVTRWCAQTEEGKRALQDACGCFNTGDLELHFEDVQPYLEGKLLLHTSMQAAPYGSGDPGWTWDTHLIDQPL